MYNVKKIEILMKRFKLNITQQSKICAAFYHSSYINEAKKSGESNERLEFLGDSVLNLIIAEYLYTENPGLPEGELTKKRAQLVREEALVTYAFEIGLAEYLYLGKGEEKTGGRKRAAIIADAFEAFLGAVFVTHGFEKAKAVLIEIVIPVFEGEKLENVTDHKSIFQEHVQVDPTKKIQYEVIQEDGPPHERLYTVIVKVDDIEYGQGIGKTKKDAEQKAAYKALQKMVR
ncbi:RNase III [Erysipelotrichaceae bacterium]|nr:RNase III [Erysipelotrichaceae bacterium]